MPAEAAVAAELREPSLSVTAAGFVYHGRYDCDRVRYTITGMNPSNRYFLRIANAGGVVATDYFIGETGVTSSAALCKGRPAAPSPDVYYTGPDADAPIAPAGTYTVTVSTPDTDTDTDPGTDTPVSATTTFTIANAPATRLVRAVTRARHGTWRVAGRLSTRSGPVKNATVRLYERRSRRWRQVSTQRTSVRGTVVWLVSSAGRSQRTFAMAFWGNRAGYESQSEAVTLRFGR
jgi:hypothetical protein